MNFFLNIIISSARDASAATLTIYPGAVATGMGGAFTAFADDMSSIYYNPAGLSNFKNNISFGWQHSNWLLGLIPDAYYEFGSYYYPTSRGTIGIGFTYLTIGEVEVYDQQNNAYKFTPYDFAISLGFGTSITNYLKLGAVVKYFYSLLIPEEIAKKLGMEGKGTAQVPALDLGILYHPYDYLNLGVSIQNIGPGLKYSGNEAPEPLPLTLRLGIGYYKKFGNLSFRASGDIVKVLVNISQDYSDSGLVWVLNEAFKHGGIELGLANVIFIRGGYFLDIYGDRIGPTFGIGARYKGLIIDVSDDRLIYRFNKEGDAKPNIRFQLSYQRERQKKTDTIPKIIIEAFDTNSRKINSFSVEIYDSSWSSLISTSEGSNGKAIISIPYGVYGMKVYSSEHFEKKDKIVFNKKHQKFKYILTEKGKARVKVEISDSLRNKPVFAKLSIGSIEKETTDFSFEIPEGIYALKISANDYEDYYKIFELKADSSYYMKVNLKPRFSYIDFKINKIAKVEIYKDNQVVDTFIDSTKLIKLPIGNYNFLITCQDCPKMEINYSISQIKDTILNINIPDYAQVFEFKNIQDVEELISKFPSESFIIEHYGPRPINREFKNAQVIHKKHKEDKFLVKFKIQQGG